MICLRRKQKKKKKKGDRCFENRGEYDARGRKKEKKSFGGVI